MNTISKKLAESEVPEDPSKRNFIKVAGTSLVLALGGSPIVGCAGLQPRTLEETLRDYKIITKDWDPIYGPPLLWFSRYGGHADFEGHKLDTKGNGARSPGDDYVVPIGTPLVPVANAFLHRITSSDTGGLTIWLNHNSVAGGYNTVYSHLSDKKIDERYDLKSGIYRVISCNEIFALSGNSGRGPEPGERQPEHLHLGLYKKYEKGDGEYLDPEKHGIDGGKLIFSDGETNLSIRAERRLPVLERVLGGFGNRLQTWQADELQELRGTLMEHYLLLGSPKGTKLLDSKHFHDIRELLKISLGIDNNLKRDKRGQIDRSEWRRKIYGPGTKPYSMMLKIVGYSTDEKQPVIVMLPFIAPGVLSKHRVAVYEQGEFLKPK